MFFSCCFRDQKNKELKNRKDGVGEKQVEIRREDSQCLLPCPDLPESTQYLEAPQLISTNCNNINNNTSNNEINTSNSLDNTESIKNTNSKEGIKLLNNCSQRQKLQAWAQWSNQKAASAFDLQLAQMSPSQDAKRLHLSAPGLDKSTPLKYPPSHQDLHWSPASNPHKSTPGLDQSTPANQLEVNQNRYTSPASSQFKSSPGLDKSTPSNYPPIHQAENRSQVSPLFHSAPGLNQSSSSNHYPILSLLPTLLQEDESTKQKKLSSERNVPKTTTISSLQTDQRTQMSSPSHRDTLGSISNCQDENNEDRSTASFGIKDLISEQMENEKQKRQQEEKERIQKEKVAEQLQKDAEEKLSKRIREDYEAILEKNRKENELLIQNLQTEYELKLKETFENHKNNVGIIVKNSKNDKMAVIMRNKNDLDNIRDGYEKLKSENDLKRQSRVHAQEEALRQSLKEVEDEDKRWKEDKQEVLDEIQRLKKEAARMVAILSAEMEEEEEDLSEEKKKNLKQEAEGLQMVVEMRTKEVRRLREKQAIMERQLEEFQITRTELGKMKARVEDLQEQIANKNQIERALNMENMKLEDSMEAKSRSSARMSLEVEQLQWRIRNSLDLPPLQLIHSMSYQEDPDHQFLQDQGYSSLNKTQRSKSAPCTPCKEEVLKVKNNLEHVDEVDGKDEVDEEAEDDSCHSCVTDPWTSADTCLSCLDDLDTVKCETSLGGDKSLLSQEKNQDESCDFKASNFVDSISSEDSDKDERNSVIANEALQQDMDASIDSGDDNDSLEKFNGVNAHYDASDEGLGDISSENESISPQPDDLRKKLCDNFECANNIDKSDSCDDSRSNYGKKNSILVDNRVPSRILFETPL